MKRLRPLTGGLFLCLLFLNTNAQVWKTVGSASTVSEGNASYTDITCDAENDYYVSYYDVNVGKGSVKKTARSTWTYVGGSAGITSNTVMSTSLAIDNSDDIYFIYRNGNDSFIASVMKFEDDAWTDLPDASSKQFSGLESAISANDDLLIFGFEAGDSEEEKVDLVRRYNGSEWVQVGTSGFFPGSTFYSPDIVISSEDTAYVSCVSNGYVHVYKNSIYAGSTTEWIPVGQDSIASATASEFFTSAMALDGYDSLYLEYFNGSNVTVQKFKGDQWSVLGNENILPNRTQHMSFAVSDEGKPYIAASNWADTDYLKNFVMTYNSASDTWEKLGYGYIADGEAKFNALMIDQEGEIVLSYSDTYYGKLVVKKFSESDIAVTGVDVTTQDGGEAIIDEDDGTLQLAATITPTDATNQEIKWSIISGSNKATVSKAGLVTATASNDTITVQATSAENSSFYDTILVVITNQFSDVDPETVEASTLNDAFADLLVVGDTLQLLASITPDEADQYYAWSVVEGEDVVSVNSSGVVTALAEGFATVRASAIMDNTVYDEISIGVFENGCKQGEASDGGDSGYNITKDSAYQCADDIIVEESTAFEIKRLRFILWTNEASEFSSLDIEILNNNDTIPGDVIKTLSGLIPVVQSEEVIDDTYYYNVIINLDDPVTLTEGTYWISPKADGTASSIYWHLITESSLGGDMCYNSGSGWEPFEGFGAVFEVVGNCTPMGHEVSMANIDLDLPRMVPIQQAKALKSTVVQVENQGLYTEEPTLTVRSDNETYFTQTLSLEPDEVKDVDVSFDLGNYVRNDTVNLYFELEDDDDENVLNNSKSVSFQVSDTTYIYDYSDEPSSLGVGSNSYNIYLGNIFELYVADTFTSVNIMFTESQSLEDQEFSFTIYKVGDEDTIDIDNPIVQEIFVRGLGGEATTFTLSPTRLEAGKYYFAAQQLSAYNYALTTDYHDGSYVVYVYNDTYLTAGYGTGGVHIRPNFGNIEQADTSTTLVAGTLANTRVKLFPNPVNSLLTLTSDNEITQLEIYNAIGVRVYTGTPYKNEVEVSAENFEPGVYYAKIKTVHEGSTIKFIVARK